MPILTSRRAGERKQLEAQIEAMRRAERKWQRDIDSHEGKREVKVDPPPELSPRARRERELLERVERLEGRTVDTGPINPARCGETSYEHERKEAIRKARAHRKDLEQKVAEIKSGIPEQQADHEARREAIMAVKQAALLRADAAYHQAKQAAAADANAALDELGPRPTLTSKGAQHE
jgi:hypothetical protein